MVGLGARRVSSDVIMEDLLLLLDLRVFLTTYFSTVHALYNMFCFAAPILLQQVVVSGPSGFVFKVESTLIEMGVPSSAMVIMD